MRLLLINSKFLPIVGGGETYILELIDYFVRRGWDVHLATSRSTSRLRHHHKATIHYLDGFDDARLEIAASIPGMRRLLDELAPDVVHVHNVMPYFIYSSITSKNEFPTVLTIHNTPELPYRLFGSFKDFRAECLFVTELLGNGHFQKLLFGSQYYLDSYSVAAPWIKRLGIAEVAHFFPPKLTTDGVSNAMLDYDDSKQIRLLFPSRILKRKGIEEALQAVSLLPKSYCLVLPGFAASEDKEYVTFISHEIQRLGITDQVEYTTEIVTPEHMPHYYKTSHIALIPSHYEGFGIVAVEAMTCGLPVITTGVGGLGEVITHESNGLIVPAKNPKQLADSIIRIVSDNNLRLKIVEGARKTVVERFGYQRHMDQVERVYAEVLDATNR